MTLLATIVVPTYARADLLPLSLPTLLAQSVAPDRYEVVVVDDASPDDTAGAVLPFVGDRVRYIRQERRRGASAARNAALAVARGDVVVLVDDDCFVDRRFLECHLMAHEQGASELAAGGIVNVSTLPTPVPEPGAWQGYHRHPMPGGNASVRREHLERVGGFDESFSIYGWQDQEVAERLLAAGLRRRFVRGAPVFHFKPPSRASLRADLERELDRGRMGARFYHKHPRTMIAMTTKMWAPIRAAERVANGLLGLEDRARRVLAGEVDASRTGLAAALLRAHVEIEAGRREWRRLRGG